MDKYSSFDELKKSEQEGLDFRVVIREREKSNTVIIAPHGGGIEPGTSEIAEELAGKDISLVMFEGIKKSSNGELHITSTNFDEPRCLSLIQNAKSVIAIHGEESLENIIYLGGADIVLGEFIRLALEKYEFEVKKHIDSMLKGKASNNICNRGDGGKGVQLELARGMRETFFDSLTVSGRKKPTDKLYIFVKALREGLDSVGKL